ncbi:MAG: alginate lyase family protein, partial [Deltaproteobacteria bacterium]|nr:alginate lyase family protein [Deltaproteobacteria bacterium]
MNENQAQRTGRRTLFMGEARWRARRLQGMPPREIAQRISQGVRRELDAWGAWRWSVPQVPVEVADRPLPALPTTAEEAVARVPVAWWERLQAEAESLLRGPFTLLGTHRGAEQRCGWTLDPATGTSWPADVPSHAVRIHRDPLGRDIKAVWELNRLQHLQVLAWSAALGDADARTACLADLEDWVNAHPPFRGVAWTTGIECAARMVSFLVVSTLLDPQAFPEPLRRALWRSLLDHAFWLERYPTPRSSAANHRVAELTALFVLGCRAPDLPGAARWRGLAPELAAVGERQFHPDGVGTEQSPTYQAYTMEWLLLALVVARTAGIHLPVEHLLRRGADHLIELLDEAGHPPRIGDDDEGVVLRQVLGPDDHLRSVCSAVSTALGVEQIAPPGGTVDPRAALLGLGTPAAAIARRASRAFPEGGYTVLRRTLAGRRTLVVMDHGPLGFGRSGGHGHADALSVWLHLDGASVLEDFGTYRYNGSPDWRTWARSTASHNTLTLSGVGQAEPWGSFGWSRSIRYRVVQCDLDDGVVVAEHDAWKARFGTVHRRALRFGTDDRVIVDDTLVGRVRHRATLRWTFSPALELTRDGEGWLAMRDGSPVLRIRTLGSGWKGRLVRGGEVPGPGVVSLRYGVLVPTWTLVVEGDRSSSAGVRTT